MIFAVDYHGTFQRDVSGFRAIVQVLQARGHTCILVTGIEDGDHFAAEVKRDVGELMPIVFAGGRWKSDAARAEGYEVDVWIEDSPEYVAEQDPRRCVGMRSKASGDSNGPRTKSRNES